MFVTSADTFTIRQWETQKTTLHQEQHSKIYPKIGYARYAEWEKTSFPKQNKKTNALHSVNGERLFLFRS